MLQELKWNSLAHRRRANRLCVFSKVYNNQTHLEDLSSHLHRAPCEHLRHTHAFRVQSITCHKNIGHYSFLPRSIRDWNSLPKDTLTNSNLEDISLLRSSILNS